MSRTVAPSASKMATPRSFLPLRASSDILGNTEVLTFPANDASRNCRWPDSNRHGPITAQRILSLIVLLGINTHLTRIRCVCGDLHQLLFTDRAKCHEAKQRFEGSACAKSLGPDRRKVNSPRAQVKGDCLL